MKKGLAPRSFSEVGFTLIETIVVIAVIGLTLPVLISTVFILVRQQTKVVRLSQVKREGDYLINTIENTIRNRAISIHSGEPTEGNIVCKGVVGSYSYSSTSSLYFRDKDKQWFGYLAGSDLISSDSAYLALPINLTSGKILVSPFSISCSRNSLYSPASILLSFDVCYDTGLPNCATTRPEEIASMHYQTRIKLRSY